MKATRITAEQLQEEMQADLKVLAEQVAETLNAARDGRIIADTEEPVREAHAVFRQKAYQRALDLLHNPAVQEAFSPSPDPAGAEVEEQGPPDDHAPDR